MFVKEIRRQRKTETLLRGRFVVVGECRKKLPGRNKTIARDVTGIVGRPVGCLIGAGPMSLNGVSDRCGVRSCKRGFLKRPKVRLAIVSVVLVVEAATVAISLQTLVS